MKPDTSIRPDILIGQIIITTNRFLKIYARNIDTAIIQAREMKHGQPNRGIWAVVNII